MRHLFVTRVHVTFIW